MLQGVVPRFLLVQRHRTCKALVGCEDYRRIETCLVESLPRSILMSTVRRGLDAKCLLTLLPWRGHRL